MKIIEKIEISYFRSFGEKKVKIYNLKDLNIFSGANDAGKSNILKALNLFFNEKINTWEEFNIENDLSFFQKEKSNSRLELKRQEGGAEVSYNSQRDLFVKVKIFFERPRPKRTFEKFWVSKSWYRNGNGSPKEDTNIQGQLKRFLDSIVFEYIPAVKDREFFKYLFKELQKSILARDSKFRNKSNAINEDIANLTGDLFKEFKDKTGIDAQFEIPESLIDFFSTIGVSTENGISLFARGDGMQARFIPAILNEISKGKKYVIWGFEEPENSYEYKNAESLANDFLKNYSKDKQIFLTSHAKEFLSLIRNNEHRVSLHRVYRGLNQSSLIETYKKGKFNKKNIQKEFWENANEQDKTDEGKNVLNKIFDDIGFLETDQYLIEDLQNQLKNQRQMLNNSDLSLSEREKIIKHLNDRVRNIILDKEKLEKEIEQYKKPVVFVEDKNSDIYKIIWLKINKKTFDENNFSEVFDRECPFLLYTKGCRTDLQKYLDEPEIQEKLDKKILGIFDFDEAFTGQFKGLRSQRWSEIEGNEGACLYKKRKDHNCCYALMIPVPKSREMYAKKEHNHTYLVMEHLFEDDFLERIDCYDGFNNPSGNLQITKIKRKDKIWKELINCDVKNLKNFIPLFDAINKLLFVK